MKKATDMVSTFSDVKEIKESTVSDANERTEGKLENTSISDTPSYLKYIDGAIEKKRYIHWESEAKRLENEKQIDDYRMKKIAVDKMSLLTQKRNLEMYRDCFDSKNVRRMASEIDSNKIEIYSDAHFRYTKEDSEQGKIMGYREYPSGKICLRDTSKEGLTHSSVHETIHDLSYQDEIQNVWHTQLEEGGYETLSRARLQSGLEVTERIIRINLDASENSGKEVFNTAINEGFTEMYTVDTMRDMGLKAGFGSYTEERGWAVTIRERLGDDTVSKAYFGGEIELLESRFDKCAGQAESWREFSKAADNYQMFSKYKLSKLAEI